MDSFILITEVTEVPQLTRSTGSTYPQCGVSWIIFSLFLNLFCEWIKHSNLQNVALTKSTLDNFTYNA